MGMMIAIGVVIASIVGAAISQQLTDEFKAWTPNLTHWLISRAVRHLPPHLRERYVEEWARNIEDIPGQIGKLIFALSLAMSSRRLAAAVTPKLASQKTVNTKRASAPLSIDRAYRELIAEFSKSLWLKSLVYSVFLGFIFLISELLILFYKFYK